MSFVRGGLFALVLGLVLIAISFIPSSSEYRFRSETQGVEAKIAAEATCAHDDYDCWNTFYADLIRDRGSLVALADLKQRYENGDAGGICHETLHLIGRAAFDDTDSLGVAFENGDTFCRSGYYHGVLEGVFLEEGSESLLTDLDRICENVSGKERYSYNYFSCVHGIGHGLMAHFNHDLFASLSGCDNLSEEWEQGSCYGGVFMENVISDSPENPSRFLKRDDLVYPCNAVEARYKQSCFLMQTSHMLAVNGGDFEGAFSECEKDSEYRITCYESLGRDASGWSRGANEEVVRMCGYGANVEQRTHCLIGAAVDFIQSQGVDAARALCAQGDESVHEACSSVVNQHAASL